MLLLLFFFFQIIIFIWLVAEKMQGLIGMVEIKLRRK